MWQKKPGHDHDHVDGRTHTHNIHLFNSVTGAEHNIHILLGVDGCPTCGRAYPKNDLGHIDPKAIVDEALAMLRENHAAVLAYAERHNIPVKVGPLHALIPDGHKLHQGMLVPARRQK